MNKTSDRYVKLVAWDEQDQCYIGRCPGLMFGGVHGDDETAVYRGFARRLTSGFNFMRPTAGHCPPPPHWTRLKRWFS